MLDALGSIPLWTYFELAETTNGCFSIAWIGRGQHSTGFGTIRVPQGSTGGGKARGEENSFGRWTRVRGWVTPPHVTPHYWTAAEMALLQMDMLGYLDEHDGEPVLVIGGGIPQQWIGREMDVRKLRVGNVLLDWRWNGQSMTAVIHGERRVKIKLGTSFPKTADLKVTYQET